jgi:parvulin-like peptidyl-prolyl isomerase
MDFLNNRLKPALMFLILLPLLIGCAGPEQRPAAATPSPVPPTRTPFPPSPTPIPSAAVVNGEMITLAQFQEELARYKAAVNRELTEEDRQLVLEELINLTLLAQAAASEGYQVSEDQLDQRLADLDPEDRPLDDWLSGYGFTQESFREHLRKSLAAAWMRDQITGEVPDQMEQIHAQQILLYDRPQAEEVQQALEEGKKFSALAENYDPQTRGDLGWFPRGYLTMPALDEILFSLEEGETSEIIETEIGYHLVRVIDRDPDRPLDPAVRLALQRKALQEWLERRWKLSTIKITLPQ